VCPLLPTRKPLLCYVTDRRGLSGTPGQATKLQIEKIEQAAKAGVDWIQLREKDLSGRELAGMTARALACAGSGSAILVNDRADVACALGASGVHLGGRSLPPGDTRRLVNYCCAGKAFLVGVSAHSLEEAIQSEQAGADYVIFGPVFATPSKAGFGPPQGVQRLQQVSKRLTIPVLAIGGITLENAKDCLAAGAAGIAAIRLFQDAADLETLVRELRRDP
jgi:thiamine-phosphate pyrophosphorylase